MFDEVVGFGERTIIVFISAVPGHNNIFSPLIFISFGMVGNNEGQSCFIERVKPFIFFLFDRKRIRTYINLFSKTTFLIIYLL